MKYWVYINGEVPGSYTPQELTGLKDFSMTSLVCPAEGEILEKNWRRSGEFADIIKALHESEARKAPVVPAPGPEAAISGDVDSLIDATSARLVSHVSFLMKELAERREEKALTVTLQRQIVALKDELEASREKHLALEGRLTRIGELEDIVRKDETAISNLEQSLRAKDKDLGEVRQQANIAKNDLESSQRRLTEALGDLAIRNKLVDKLSRDLSDKEVSLTKALGAIRRLEEDLNRLLPQPPAPAPQPVQESAPAPETKLEPIVPAEEKPVEEAPKDQPAAQGAIVDKFKKFISRYDH
jgi:hypothetical protein